MGLLGLAVGLIVLNHAFRTIDNDNHRRMHRHGIHHHHNDSNLSHTRSELRHHNDGHRTGDHVVYGSRPRPRFGTRRDGRRYRKR